MEENGNWRGKTNDKWKYVNKKSLGKRMEGGKRK